MNPLDTMPIMRIVDSEASFKKPPPLSLRDAFLPSIVWILLLMGSDLGIWSDDQIPGLHRIVNICHAHNVKIGIQLAHAGRKASTYAPGITKGHDTIPKSEGGWEIVAPSAIAYSDMMDTPHALTTEEVHQTVEAFVAAAKRAVTAGYDFIQIHAAHGYLLHEFLSPLSNQRTDAYGGTFENRTRIVREVARAIRAVIPEGMPLFVRISASDFAEGGWEMDQSCELAQKLCSEDGVDGIDCSSAGLVPTQQLPREWDFQVKMGAELKKRAGVTVVAVGGIADTHTATYVADELGVDAIDVGKAALRHAFNPRSVAIDLGQPVAPFPTHIQWAYRVPSYVQY